MTHDEFTERVTDLRNKYNAGGWTYGAYTNALDALVTEYTGRR